MILQALKQEFSICKLADLSNFDCSGDFFFMAKTDGELSLVCETACVPTGTIDRDDGWRAFRVKGTLDFSLTVVLSKITAPLAKENIGVFAVSTYDTDYVLTKGETFNRALAVLADNGFIVEES